jgi:hypothetical protein
MAETKAIRIQARIAGYFGPAVNLLAALDPDTGLVIVSRELPLTERLEGALLTTNDPRADGRDRLFSEDRFEDAIRRYYRARAIGTIQLLPPVQKHDPGNRIEADGMNESGTKYRLASEIGNGAVAVLAVMDAAGMALKVEDAAGMAGEISEMFFSIGGESYLDD